MSQVGLALRPDGTLVAESDSFRVGLAYDFRNQLSQSKQGTSETDPASVNSYEYDREGRLIQGVVTTASQPGATTTQFVYVGDQLYAELDGAGAVLARYAAGDDGTFLGRVDTSPAGALYYYATDVAGSVASVYSVSPGQRDLGRVEAIEYRGLHPVVTTAPGFSDWFTTGGRLTDENTGLQWADGRWLDPKSSRFTSEASGRLGSEKANLYEYDAVVDMTDGVDPVMGTPTGHEAATKLGTWVHNTVPWLGFKKDQATKVTTALNQWLNPVALFETFAPRDSRTGEIDWWMAARVLNPATVVPETLEWLRGDRTNRFFRGVKKDYEGYRRWAGQGEGEAWVNAVANNTPVANWPKRIAEFRTGVSQRGADYGRELDRGDYAVNALSMGMDFLLARAVVRSGPVARGLNSAASDFVHGTLGGTRAHAPAAWVANRFGFRVCFAAGTPVRTPGGHASIETVRAGDQVLSRDESDPTGPVSAQTVEEVFVREGLVWHLHVAGQVLRTTAEHPFYLAGRGWAACHELKVGDQLLCEDGTWAAVEDLLDTGEWETVYNFRVKDFHTYFVGCGEWGFSVWAHNAECAIVKVGDEHFLADVGTGRLIKKVGSFDDVASHLSQTGDTLKTSLTAAERSRLRHIEWAGDMAQVNGTMAQLARRALREGGGSWERAEAVLSRYAEAMNNRFGRVGSSKRAVVDATVVDGSGVVNRSGYGTRAEPWRTNPDGSIARFPDGRPIPTGSTRRIELGIESTALPGRPILSAVDISYSYTKPFLWTEYTNAYGLRVPIADVRMSRNLRRPSDPILNYVEWRQGGSVTSRQDFGRQGLPPGW